MTRAVIQRNQCDCLGMFAHPVFLAWSDTHRVLEGLYQVFDGFHAGLSDFRIEGSEAVPSEQAVVVSVGSQFRFRFYRDRLDCTLSNFTDADLDVVPTLLQKAQQWASGLVEGFAFKSHMFTYAAHCALDESSKELLTRISSVAIASFGNNRGSGFIFHADSATPPLRIQLTMDHSLLIPDGLYLQLLLISLEPAVDYTSVLPTARRLLRAGLEELGVELAGGSHGA